MRCRICSIGVSPAATIAPGWSSRSAAKQRQSVVGRHARNVVDGGGVLVAATEGAWSHTIAPSLIAANANLSRVYRIDAIILDPLLSRLDAGIDGRPRHRHGARWNRLPMPM